MLARAVPTLSGISIPLLHQTAGSDLHLLTRLGQQYHLLIKPAGNKLVALPLGAAVAVPEQPSAEAVLDAGRGDELEPTAL